jgi:hypothetical protein
VFVQAETDQLLDFDDSPVHVSLSLVCFDEEAELSELILDQLKWRHSSGLSLASSWEYLRVWIDTPSYLLCPGVCDCLRILIHLLLVQHDYII